MSRVDDPAGPGGAYADRVRGWAEELRAGSSLTWQQYLDTEVGPSRRERPGALPGAAQLELVRRLSARPDLFADVPDFSGLADLVLDTPGPGRGLVDVPLPWAAGSPEAEAEAEAEAGPGPSAGTAIGTPPVAPEDLPAEELLRVCTGVLVRLLAAEPPAVQRRPTQPWRPWRRGFTLLGAPATVELVRSALLAGGLREGGPRATYLVLGGPLEELMAQRWSARIRGGAGIRWQRMWRVAVAHDRVPPGIALPALADHLVEQVGASRVHVVLGTDAATTLRLVGEILGARVPDAVPDRHDALATDLLRRVNPVLTLAVGEAARHELIDNVWSELVGDEDDGPLAAPAGQVDWAVGAGERMASALSEGRYAVHGDPALVVPTRRPGVRRAPAPEDVLPRALAVVGRAWRRHVGGAATGKGRG